MLNSLYGIHPLKLKEFLGEYFPAYRARQLLKWIYSRFVFDVSQMTDLPADFKDLIQNSFDLSMPGIKEKLESSDGSTKFRLALADNAQIEMVLMPQEKKQTLCLSTQVGCSRGCAFCATGRMKLQRDLQPHEIIQQILLAAQSSPRKLTNLVFMGMGEPLDNLDNVLEVLKLIQAEDTLVFSPRRTTISTCGIIPGIYRLADSGIKAKLAVSLNSAIDKVRDELMPVNKLYPLSVLKKALLYYQRKSRFRVTFEYILIPGVNMSGRDINALQKFSGDISCKINFIPYNQVLDLSYPSPTPREIESFMQAAQSLSQAVTLRRSRGSDISGACGQLVVKARSKNNGGSL
jgi:23S rRNA (adenine2503-C2)-methyltransferase